MSDSNVKALSQFFYAKKPEITGLVLMCMSVFFTPNIEAATVDRSEFDKLELDLQEPDFSILNQNDDKSLFQTEDFSFFGNTRNQVQDLLRSGLRHLKEGNVNKGIMDLEKAWKIAPELAATGASLAYAYLLNKDYKQALSVSEALQKSHPDKHQGYNLSGFAYQFLGDKKLSKDAFIKANELAPGDPTAGASLADYALSEKNSKQAKDIYLNVLKHNPDHLRTVLLMARLDSSQNDVKHTEKRLSEILQKSPDTTVVHYQFAQIYNKLKKSSLALEEIKKALKLEPNHAPSTFLYAKLLANEGKLDTARGVLKKLAEAHPQKAVIKELEGRIALMQSQPADAAVFFQEALKLQDSTPLIIQLATAQIRAGKTEEGLNTLRSRLEQSPSDILLRSLFAELLRKNNRLDDAQKQYVEIVRQNPDSIGARNNLAWLLAEKGDLEAALVQAKQAHDAAPSEPNVMDTYGVILLKQQQFGKAKSLFEAALAKLPDNLSIRFHLAQSLAGMNELAQAKQQLQKILAENKSFKEGQQAEKLLVDLKSR